jgi:hypothetical protein
VVEEGCGEYAGTAGAKAVVYVFQYRKWIESLEVYVCGGTIEVHNNTLSFCIDFLLAFC